MLPRLETLKTAIFTKIVTFYNEGFLPIDKKPLAKRLPRFGMKPYLSSKDELVHFTIFRCEKDAFKISLWLANC